jgi:hypothetical protein
MEVYALVSWIVDNEPDWVVVYREGSGGVVRFPYTYTDKDLIMDEVQTLFHEVKHASGYKPVKSPTLLSGSLLDFAYSKGAIAIEGTVDPASAKAEKHARGLLDFSLAHVAANITVDFVADTSTKCKEEFCSFEICLKNMATTKSPPLLV